MKIMYAGFTVFLLSGCQGSPMTGIEVSPPTEKSSPVPSPLISPSPSPTGPFDVAPDIAAENAVPGEITILFRDSYQVRANSRTTVTSNDEQVTAKINKLLSSYNVKQLVPGDPNSSEAQALESEKRTEASLGGDQPNGKSFCYAIFPINTNIEAAIRELRSISAVRIAYRSPKV